MNMRKVAGRTRSLTAVLIVAVLVLTPPTAATFAAEPAGAAPDAGRQDTVAGLISAAVKLSPTLARLEAGIRLVPRGSVLTRAGQLRPAADLGTWARSLGYERVSPELGDALAEGSAPDATTRDWTRCYEKGNGAAVICPDGFIEVN